MAKVATHQRDVALAAVHFALVGDHAEFAMACLDAALAGADDIALVAQAVADQLGDGENLQTVFLAERNQVGNAGHLAVVAHDFADHAGGVQPGQPRQIDRRLGLAGAHQHASLARAQRKDVAGTRQIS